MEFNKYQHIYRENGLETKILLELVYGRKPCHQFNSSNAAKLVGLAKLHGLIPLIFYRLKEYESLVSDDVYAYFKNHYLSSLAINLQFWKAFLGINEVFCQKNIALVPIKGVDILTRFYPSFDLRSMSDIDVLVKEDEFAQTEKILTELGYQKKLLGLKEAYWRQKQCHIAFYKNQIMVEVHWGLDFKRGKRIILPLLWERTKELTIRNHKIRLFSDEDAFFCFALHLRRFSNILSLKQVLDVARIINQSVRFDWDYILKESKRGGMQATVYFMLMQLLLFTDARIPKEAFAALRIPSWQKRRIKNFVLRNTFKITWAFKEDYLKAHLLLYDNIFEPIFYLINIPYEQFCKFYNLKPYSHKTNMLYNLRFLYMPVSLCLKKKLKAGMPIGNR